jgi:GNAT superfamily N-acetyltransferase
VTFTTQAGEYLISDDPALIDIDVVHRWLSEDSYWSRGRTRQTVERSIAHSIPLGVYHHGVIVGFARVVTDRSTFAWLCDVFVTPEHRNAGVGKALVAAAVGHPDLAEIKRFVLATADAHDLYRQYGFEIIERPERWMIRRGTID